MSRKISLLSKKSGRMYQKSGPTIEKFYYENPLANPTVRELAVKTGLAKSSVQYQLKKLKEQGIISNVGTWVNNWKNKVKKTSFYINLIIESGLVDYLEKELVTTVVILFGSFSKGESINESDIDIFVECAKINKKVNLNVYERKLGHKIELFTRNKITQLPKNLLNNVVNGIKLKGYYIIK